MDSFGDIFQISPSLFCARVDPYRLSVNVKQLVYMGKTTLSIIIPVYNQEKYIEECLKSLFLQLYANIEVIMIDDGSTDESLAICKSWSNKDSRFKCFAYDNAGVAVARNRGLSHSSGDFITFIDPDDFISNDAFLNNIPYLEEQFDIVQYPYREFPDSGVSFGPQTASILSTEQLVEQVINFNINYSCCNKIFRKSLFDGLSFKKDYYEDMDLLIDIFNRQPKIYISDIGMYYYRRHIGSSTKSTLSKQKDKEQYESIIKRGDFVIKHLFSLGLNTDPRSIYWCIVSVFRDIKVRTFEDDRKANLLHFFNEHFSTSISKIIFSRTNWHDKKILFYYKAFGLDKTLKRLCHF